MNRERAKRATRSTVPLLAGRLLILARAAPAQTTLSYYFAHIAAADVWRTTFTAISRTVFHESQWRWHEIAV